MSFESSIFLTMMPSTVTISGRTAHSNHGVPTYSTGTSYRARVVNKPKFIRQDANHTIAIQTEVWLASTGGTITVDDRITLPDGSTPPILQVERFGDSQGEHHVKLMLGGGGNAV